ncbi:MAG: YncE family protein [Terriglobia bacterium]
MRCEKVLIRRLITLAAWVVVADFAAAQMPSPALLVVNKDENAMAIVDPIAKKVVGSVRVGDGPHEVAASDDGKLAFVSNYGPGNATVPGSTISVIDLATKKELRKFEIGPNAKPHGVVFAGGKVYFTAEGFDMIGAYDPASNKMDWMLGTGQDRTHVLVLNHDRTKIFASNINSDSINIMERVGNPPDWTSTVVKVGKGPEAIDLSPDGKEVWTAHTADGAVSVIDVASKKVAHTLSLNMVRANRLKFTPDGKYVLITDARGGKLLVLDAATKKEVKRIAIGAGPTGIQMVPGNRQAIIAVSGDHMLAFFDLNKLEVTDRFSPGKNPDGMHWIAAE